MIRSHSKEGRIIIPTEREKRQVSEESLPFGVDGDLREKVQAFAAALERQSTKELLPFMSDERFIDLLIIQKGKHLTLFERAMNTVQQEILGHQGTSAEDAEQLLQAGVSSMALAEHGAAAYHLQNDFGALRRSKMIIGAAGADPIAAGYARNVWASLMGRHGNMRMQNALNQQALAVAADALPGDKRAAWLDMKARHGLLANSGNVQEKLHGFLDLAKRRAQLGDDVHVPRSLLDAARAARELGDDVQAEQLYREAYHGSFAVGYSNVHQMARDELHALHEMRRNRPAVVHGVGKGERLHTLERNWQFEAERRDELMPMRNPAHLLVELDGKYLVRASGEGKDLRLHLPVVDQELTGSKGGRNPHGIIKEKLASSLNMLMGSIDIDAARSGIDLSTGKIKKPQVLVRNRKGRLREDQKEYAYKMALKAGTAIEQQLAQGLDKMAGFGYVLLAKDELIAQRSACDTSAQMVIDAMIALEEKQKAAA